MGVCLVAKKVGDLVADPEFIGILIEFSLCLGVCRFCFVEISGEGGQ